MAGDWIKFETATLTKPEVLKLARITGLDRHAIVGRLLVFWTWCDTNAVDGVVDACVDATVDALVDAPGFALALQRVGWLEIDNDAERLKIPKFDRHNGKSAKNRVLKTERQRKWREKSVDACVDGGVSTREEKRREEIEERKNKAKKKADEPDGARKRAPVFEKPTTNEVAAYCTERGNNVDPVAFVDYYESVNWHVGKKRMSDWKAAVRTWEKRNAENQRSNGGSNNRNRAERFFDAIQEFAATGDVDSGTVREAGGEVWPQVVEFIPGRAGKTGNG
jgi:hypothetical protein